MMNRRWFPRTAFALLSLAAIVVLFIAACQPTTSPPSKQASAKPSSSPQPAEVSSPTTQSAIPSRVFEPAVAEIRGKTKLPLVLTSKLPAEVDERRIKLATGMVSDDGYNISLYY